MNRVVLDASALLAILNQEAGAERLTPELLSAAAISTVNLAEVQGKLVGWGLSPEDAWEAALSPVRETVPFTSEHARIGAIWWHKPAHLACPWVAGLVWRSGLL
jgi:PIN domain nuclease of toxin-antitoxin system